MLQPNYKVIYDLLLTYIKVEKSVDDIQAHGKPCVQFN